VTSYQRSDAVAAHGVDAVIGSLDDFALLETEARLKLS
jgi:hypothetical protein